MIVLGVLASFGLLLNLMLWAGQRRLAGSPPPFPPPDKLPFLSILKPVKGVDADLETNLRSFFNLDYPDFELVVGAPDATDPALEIVRRVAAEFPAVRSRIVEGADAVGLNPKMNLVSALARRAEAEILLISDSNIEAPPGYLRDIVAHLLRPNVGLVSSPFRGTKSLGVGGAVEALQLNTYVIGGVAALHLFFNQPCVVGKSMLFRRGDLELIGGFAFLGRHLAEDQVCGEEMRARGREVVVAGCVIDNVLGRRTVRQFLDRHLRWCRIRRRISLPGYVGELLLNPVGLVLIGAVIVGTAGSLAIFGGTLLGMSALGAAAERGLGVRRPLLYYPALELLRSVLVVAVWAVPLFSRTVSWRGDRMKIGPRTRLEPVGGTGKI